ncbi:Cif family virulence factor [Dethiobacter alkaliphilus]|uniref:nuclear transport factor 2 family protein n=1 Tax=Dethiobacter alkaliphilus TaxID=427926 RepID=UPI002226C0DD|nr:nuclear transport factor 2 family protein [Dethiobacter alkaliphilus]MCW3490484.1 nuclear transport factor 2 family protein [Dethiobacter alkaliphilus]
MPRVTRERLQEFEDFLGSYNECWYKKDLSELRKMHAQDGDIIYFDNHKDCDSFDIDDHLKKVKHFFETGNIVNLLYENMIVYEKNNSACIIVTLRYSDKPKPGVRSTYYLEKEEMSWRIRHIHYSFDPNEE